MNLKENVKNIKENLNELARKSQTKTALLVLGFIATLIFIGWMFMHSEKEQPIKKIKKTNTQNKLYVYLELQTVSLTRNHPKKH